METETVESLHCLSILRAVCVKTVQSIYLFFLEFYELLNSHCLAKGKLFKKSFKNYPSFALLLNFYAKVESLSWFC